jgi:hypothetical protein
MVTNKNLISAIKKELSKKIKVGYLHDDGEHELPLPALAKVLHEGDEEIGIPPRPFFSNYRNNYAIHLESGLKKITIAALKGESAHITAGEIFKKALSEAVKDYRSGAGMPNTSNSYYTAKKKGFDHVLKDGGYMIEGVEFEIIDTTGGTK